ncbi:MAG: hypothetical protein KA214_08590 [Neisseriaceae bacterium]|nr:hypothetical protein [Neisseriaceae bacterium]
MQSIILQIAIMMILLVSVYIVVRHGSVRWLGTVPLPLFSFIAILFMSGLDAGLVMLPLNDFPEYAANPDFAFASPVALEFGFWGFLVWLFYFVTAFYFCKIEPRLQLFEIWPIKFVNNCITISTCAFTAYLFLINLPTYIIGISEWQRYLLTLVVVMASVYSSSKLTYLRFLSVLSTCLFLALIVGVWWDSQVGVVGFLNNVILVEDYFRNIHRFALPINDFHEWYLLWWCAWSIMIGQFMAKFVGNLSSRQMVVSMMIVPSVLLAIWFAVLYGFYQTNTGVSAFWGNSMVVVAVLFMVTSLDSLVRLYSGNLNWTAERVGFAKYFISNTALMMGLVILYLFTPLRIELVGMIVCGLYFVIIALMILRRKDLVGVLRDHPPAST